MQEEKVIIESTFNFNDNTNLQYNFTGRIQESVIEISEIKKNINNIFQNRKTAPTIVEATTIIKTALKDIIETKLDISIWKEEGPLELVNYRRSKLNIYYYSYNAKLSEKKDFDLQFKYDKSKGFSYTTNRVNTKTNSKPLNYIKEIFTEKMTTLYELENFKIINLSICEQIICKIYKLFYQTNPNFSRKKDIILAQSMLAFLNEFGITIPINYYEGDFYSFNLNSQNIVASLELTQQLNKIAPLGEIKDDFSEINPPTEVEQTIKVVGREICKHMSTKENPVDWFKDLVRVNYIKKFYLPSNSTAKEIAEKSKCLETDVKSNLKLIKTIGDKVYQD